VAGRRDALAAAQGHRRRVSRRRAAASSPDFVEIDRLGTVSSAGWSGRESARQGTHLEVRAVKGEAGQGHTTARGGTAATASDCRREKL